MKLIKWILTVFTIVPSVIILSILPDTVPVHFDIYGNPDRYGSKFELLILPIIALVSIFIFSVVNKAYKKQADFAEDDKKRSELVSNAKVLNVIMLVMSAFMCVLNIVFLYNTYIIVNPEVKLPEFEIFNVVGVILGLTLVILGNYMTKTRNNKFIGFRLPWTMYNDTTWRKSNKFASYVMIVAGIISMLVAIFAKGIIATLIMLGSLLISIPVIMVYAYIVYREERGKDSEEFKK